MTEALTSAETVDAGSAPILWYTRCPVPTASGIAHARGWLAETAANAGLELRVLQDAAPEVAVRHFDHALPGLIREGGNVPALAARASGSSTRVIGLTWIDEAQAILVRPDSPIAVAADLRGARLAVPAWAVDRARSFPRAMALHGYLNALRVGGLDLADARLVEIPTEPAPQVRGASRATTTWGIDALLAGDVDAVYVKGARAQDVALAHGLRAAVDLDTTTRREDRVNNGTPRPITVHQSLLDTQPEVVVDFLVRSLRAADWAAHHPDEARAVLASETGSASAGAAAAYPDRVIADLRPSLTVERIDLLRRQQQFLLAHGFLDADFDIDTWVDSEPLSHAQEIVALERVDADDLQHEGKGGGAR